MDLVDVFNACLSASYFPVDWKNATIILLQKQGKDPVMPASYRPISLLPGLAKVFERIIHNRLKPFLKHIPDEQFGFMPERSTTQQLVRILEWVGGALRNKESSAFLMLDVAKAFDRVYHKGIIFKMIQLEFPSNLIHLLRSYLKSRTFNVKLGNTISSTRNIKAGVPQGSILGPILYILYTYDFPKFEDDHNCLTAFYADDTAIITKSMNPEFAVEKLVRKMDAVEDWCSMWKVAINATKSQILVIKTKGKRKKTKTKVTLFGTHIPIVKKASYLGLKLNQNLNWSDHFKSVAGKTVGIMNNLRPIMGRHSKLGLHLKKRLYESSIRPVLTYASPAWATATKNEYKILQTAQNKILREMAGATRYVRNDLIHRDLHIKPIEEHIASLNINFYKKAVKDTSILHETLNYEVLAEDRHRRPYAAFALSDAVLSAAFQL